MAFLVMTFPLTYCNLFARLLPELNMAPVPGHWENALSRSSYLKIEMNYESEK